VATANAHIRLQRNATNNSNKQQKFDHSKSNMSRRKRGGRWADVRSHDSSSFCRSHCWRSRVQATQRDWMKQDCFVNIFQYENKACDN